MTPTDDERRRVAAALRRVDAERLDRMYGNDPSHAPLTLSFVAEAVGLHYAPYEFTAVELRNRLADLIDPDSHPDSHPNCGTEEVAASSVPKFGREAPLALADELEAYRLPISGIAVAEHIREACGETANGLPTSREGRMSDCISFELLVGGDGRPPGDGAPEKN